MKNIVLTYVEFQNFIFIKPTFINFSFKKILKMLIFYSHDNVVAE